MALMRTQRCPLSKGTFRQRLRHDNAHPMQGVMSMPLYEFGCNMCGAGREVLSDYETAQSLELICVQCGGVQTLRPVLAVNVLRSRASAVTPTSGSREVGNTAQRQGKACGHTHHCRCAVKLTKPNPFRDQIRKATGIVDEQ